MSAGEKAMALVDGQLAPTEVPSLVQELARNSALVAELQAYLALSRNRIAASFAALGDEPAPRRLIDAIMRAPTAQHAPRLTPKVSSMQRLRAWLQGSCRVPAWSLAAAPTLATLALVAVYWLAVPRAPRGQGEVGMATALERTESGDDAALATLRPVLSFNSKADGWCRQFDVMTVDRKISHALACRDADGHWNVLAATPPGATGYAPAGTNRRKPIDDLVTSMMRDQPLSPNEETAEIRGGWQ